MSSPDVGDPITRRFVDRLLERGLADCDRDNFRAEEFYARDVQGLPHHIDLAHVNHALATEARGDGCGCDTLLAGAGLGDNPAFPHSLREQNLAERIVDLVRAGVKEVFALEINLWTRESSHQAFGKIERR